jgi:hypothetical protein
MKIRGWYPVVGTLVLIKGVSPLSAIADEPLFMVNPSIGIAGVVDDNVFGSPTDREHDFILRVSPAIEAEYRGSRLTLQGGYIQDAEAYWEFSELNSAQARQYGVVQGQYRSTEQLTLELETSYTETERANDFNVVTGLAGSRARASRTFINPSLRYQFTPATGAGLGYSYAKDRVKNGVGSETRIEVANLSHRFTARDTATLQYEHQEFVFGSVADPVNAHVVMVGDTHAFSERTSATVMAGPRYTEDSPLSDESTDIDVSIQFRQLYETSEYTLNYYRSRTTALNVVGLVDNHTINATFIYFPERHIEFRVSPEYGRSTSELSGREADGFQLTVDVTKHLDRAWSAVGSYRITHQEGSLNGIGGDRVLRNMLMIGMVYAPFALGKDGTMLLDNRTKLREGLLPRMDIRP